MAALEDPTNVALVATGLDINSTVTPDGDFTELSDNGEVNGSLTLEVQRAANQTACTPTFATADAGILALEIRSAGASGAGDVQLDIETGWIKLGDLQGLQRVWWIMILGELLSACRLRIRLKRDYDEAIYFDDKIWTPSPGVLGGPIQVAQPGLKREGAGKLPAV